MSKGYDNSKHKRLINTLTVAGALTNGFDAFVRSLLVEDREEYDMLLERCDAVVPDAYQFDEDEQELIVYEVEVTHPCSDSKIEKYAQWWCALDSIGWDLRLVIVGRFNNRHEIELFDVRFPAKRISA